ncbi:MAG TPA: caspase family protein [Panacibacter sp.]|nr:caspase family protein [Panacibacter sp.]
MKYLSAILLLIGHGFAFARQPTISLPLGHTDKINDACFSADGKKIVTGSNDNTIKIWETQTGTLLANIKVPYSPGYAENENVLKVQFSKDGKRVISKHRQSAIKIWDAATGRLLANTKWNQGEDFLVSPNTKKIALLPFYYYEQPDADIYILDDQTGDSLASLKSPLPEDYFNIGSPGVLLLRWSPTGESIAQVVTNQSHTPNACYIWNVHTGQLISRFKFDISVADDFGQFKTALPVMDLTWSPAGDKIAFLASNDSISAIQVWDAQTGDSITSFTGNGNHQLITGKSILFDKATWSKDSRTIITCRQNGIKIWDAMTGEPKEEKKANIYKASWSHDGFVIDTNVLNNERYAVPPYEIQKLTAPAEDFLRDPQLLFYSPDGNIIAAPEAGNTVQLWDVKTGEKLAQLKSYMSPMNGSVYSNNNKILATLHDDNMIRIWDAGSGAFIATVKGYTASFSNDGKRIVTAVSDSTVKIWDTRTGDLLMSPPPFKAFVSSIEWSNDDRFLFITMNVSADYDFSSGERVYKVSPENVIARIWDIENNKPVFEQKGIYHLAQFSPDGTKLVTGMNGNAQLWNVKTRLQIAELKGHPNEISYISFSPDGTKLVTGSSEPGDRRDWSGSYMVWDATTGKLITGGGAVRAGYAPDWSTDSKRIAYVLNEANLVITSIDNEGKTITLYHNPVKPYDSATNPLGGQFVYSDETNHIMSFSFHPDGKRVIVSYQNNTARIWDIDGGKILQELKGYSGINFFAAFNKDGKRTITTSQQGFAGIWDTDSGKLIYSFFTADSASYFVFTPDNYYHSSPDAARSLHYVTADLTSIGFEQLDVKYNRPDMVMQASGSEDTALINAYKKAYYKRIRKLGVDTSAFADGYSLPDIDIINRNEIGLEQKTQFLQLHIKGMDKKFLLEKFNILVNEVPVFGLKGINISGKASNSFDTTIDISLSEGDNKIEATIVNTNGIESYRKPLFIKYQPENPLTGKTYFAGIGIDLFMQKEHNLNYSVKDIRVLAGELAMKMKNIVIDTLFNEQVSRENIIALKNRLLQSTENDKVIVAYSGHGLLSKDYDYFLSTYNVSFSDPAREGLPYEELENLLDGIKARKKLLLIDACHSGEVDKEELNKRNTSGTQPAQPVISGSTSNKGAVVENTDESAGRSGLQNSFELMQNLFVNVGKGTGATVISASGGVQVAQERSDLGHGVFTYSIIEAMDKYPTIKISALKKYIGYRVTQITDGVQKPTFRSETQSFDWSLW